MRIRPVLSHPASSPWLGGHRRFTRSPARKENPLEKPRFLEKLRYAGDRLFRLACSSAPIGHRVIPDLTKIGSSLPAARRGNGCWSFRDK